MDSLAIIVTVIGSAAAVCGPLIIIRTEMALRERRKVLRAVSELASKDIAHRRDWVWRHREFLKVRFNEMVLKFWRPVGSFYADSPALKE